MLRSLPSSANANLLAGTHRADDAAVYRLSDDLALVQTVDFFTPIVDDPFSYGEIAAANSLSDVYAVGGTPLTALNIVSFPRDTLPLDVLAEILRGGASKAAEAGIVIVGGHTVDDLEPKYGLSVTGTVHPNHFVTPRGARPGDLLVLTKPLGTGTIATALKANAAAEADVQAAVESMRRLNRSASSAMMVAGAHAATDVTGFGLAGHLLEMCDVSNVSARLTFSDIPLLPGALGYISAGFVPGGTRTNLEFVAGRVHFSPDLPPAAPSLLADPQTSGGLLISLPPDSLNAFQSELGGEELAVVIGVVTGESPSTVRVL